MDRASARLCDKVPAFPWRIPCREWTPASLVACRAHGNAASRYFFRATAPILSFEPDQVPAANSIPPGGPACDYALLGTTPGPVPLTLVELKGGHVAHAVEQLDSTLRTIQNTGIRTSSCHAYIVRSGHGSITRTSLKNEKEKFKRNNCWLRLCRPNTPESAEPFPHLT